VTTDNPLSTPNPDPTARSLDALYREVASVREVFGQRLDSAKEREAAGFANVERSFDLLNRERTGQFASLQTLLEGRVEAEARVAQERFDTAERSRVEQKQDTKAAVDAALSAAKEAVKEQTTASERSIAKSEAATAKQLEQQQLTTTTALQSLRTSIDEMKERSIEDVRVLRQGINDAMAIANASVQQKVGAGEQRQEHTDNRVAVYTTIGLVVSLVIATIAIVGFVIAEAGRVTT
jgi:hypothetical protein